MNAEFAARRIETTLDWDDLVMPESDRQRLMELLGWLRKKSSLRESLASGRRSPSGQRALFHGASGTGKTLAATLLGKSTSRDVYRIDLSAPGSRYIGETEKNLSRLFDGAKKRDWILFFDEADALFGKRTAVKDSHDRYANQEASYLLRRMENYDGLCIVGSKHRASIDDAFLRCFDSIIDFPDPGSGARREK